MVCPDKTVYVPPSVIIQMVVAAVAALVGLLATFFQASLHWTVWGSALMLLASRASQVYFQAASERNEIERECVLRALLGQGHVGAMHAAPSLQQQTLTPCCPLPSPQN